MAGDQAPNDQSSEPTPIANNNRLSATNSHVGDVVQVLESPGAVVIQGTAQPGAVVINGSADQSSALTGLLTVILGVLLLLVVVVLSLLGKLILSAVSLALAGFSVWLIVAGFFSWVESLLKNATKSEIAGWLIGVEIGKKVDGWPGTFVRVFDQVFGEKHLSWKCFWRSCTASLGATLLAGVLTYVTRRRSSSTHSADYVYQHVYDVASVFIANVLPDYFAYFLTRLALRNLMKRQCLSSWAIVIILQVAITLYLSSIAFTAAFFLYGWEQPEWHFTDFATSVWRDAVTNPLYPIWTLIFYHNWMFIFPSFFTSTWLFLYVGSGFLLKAARRFDIAFKWFNRKFDFETRPLSAIGLVAGALVAVIWWTCVIVKGIV